MVEDDITDTVWNIPIKFRTNKELNTYWFTSPHSSIDNNNDTWILLNDNSAGTMIHIFLNC